MCLRPIQLKVKESDITGTTQGHVVPCGVCADCLARRANDWILRLSVEDKVHKSSLFLTLTYGDGKLGRTKNNFLSLNKRDWQLFMKNVRFQMGKHDGDVKYYMCGEYGKDTYRPHYHAILFDVPEKVVTDNWDHGHCVIGTVRGGSIAYVTKYICKTKRIPMHRNDDRLPEFSLMSKNMGASYLTPEMVKYHRDGEVTYMLQEGGFKHRLPRYYRDKIWTVGERQRLFQVSQVVHRDQLQQAMEAAGSANEFYRLRMDHNALTQRLFDDKINSKRNTI